MTATPAPKNTALLFAKIVHLAANGPRLVGWHPGFQDPYADDRAAVLAAADDLAAQRVIDIHHSPITTDQVSVSLIGTAAPFTVPVAALTSSADADTRAKAAMWLWLLIRGGHGGTDPHSGFAPWGRGGEVGHLTQCGLDLDRCSAVTDDVWSEFTDTYSDNNDHVGVSGTATCACGKVTDLSMFAEVDSISAYLNQVLSAVT